MPSCFVTMLRTANDPHVKRRTLASGERYNVSLETARALCADGAAKLYEAEDGVSMPGVSAPSERRKLVVELRQIEQAYEDQVEAERLAAEQPPEPEPELDEPVEPDLDDLEHLGETPTAEGEAEPPVPGEE